MTVGVPNWLKEFARRYREHPAELYLVGGALRDQILGQDPKEWDMATSLKPSETEKLLKSLGAQNIGTIGRQFGTITAQIENHRVEITTFRGESYSSDSRKPEVNWGTDINEDLARRDFTINAIAYDFVRDRLIDPHSGQLDLNHKVIRAVGNPLDRFDEDPLRMLRALRFAAVLGFSIDQETYNAVIARRERLAIVSSERIAEELNRALLSPQPSRFVRLSVESALVAYFLPELIPTIDLEFDPAEHKDIYEHILAVLDKTEPKLELRWCALLHDIAKPLTRKKNGGLYSFHGHENVGAKIAQQVLRRLKYPNSFVDYVAKLVRLHQRLPNYNGDWSDGAIRRFVREAGETLDDLFSFAEADVTGSNLKKIASYRQNRQALRERIDELEHQAQIAKITSPLDGNELMAIFKRPAGPWLGEVKKYLLDLVLDGKLKQANKKTATELARKYLLKKQK